MCRGLEKCFQFLTHMGRKVRLCLYHAALGFTAASEAQCEIKCLQQPDPPPPKKKKEKKMGKKEEEEEEEEKKNRKKYCTHYEYCPEQNKTFSNFDEIKIPGQTLS